MYKKQVYGLNSKQVYSMKFDMHIKNNNKKCNPTIRFSKYLVRFIFLVKVLAIDYNQVCSQTLSNVYLLFLSL